MTMARWVWSVIDAARDLTRDIRLMHSHSGSDSFALEGAELTGLL